MTFLLAVRSSARPLLAADDGISERFLLSRHESTKRFVDDYEYIRIYLLQDFFDSRWLGAEFPSGAELFSVCGKPTCVEVRR